MSDDHTIDATPEKDLVDIAAEALDTKLQEMILVCNAQLDEAGDTSEDRKVFFLQHPESPTNVRLFGVQGENQHAVFSAVLGFVPEKPNLQIYVGDPQLREGTVEERESPSKIVTPGAN